MPMGCSHRLGIIAAKKPSYLAVAHHPSHDRAIIRATGGAPDGRAEVSLTLDAWRSEGESSSSPPLKSPEYVRSPCPGAVIWSR